MAQANRVEDEEDASARLAALPLPLLEARLRERLDPLQPAHPDGPVGSDFDLNPGLEVPISGLVPSAVLVPLIVRGGGVSVLFTQRASQLRRHAGQVSFPGGRCEPGETPWSAALREAHEEVGLDPAAVTLAGLSTPYRTITGYHITPVVGLVHGDASLTLNPAEVAMAFEVPFTFLMDPANHERRYRDHPPGPPRWHYAITWGAHLIWGATAGMTRALYERLERPDAGGA